MDIATIIGLIGGTLIVLAAVSHGSSPDIFLNLSGLLIVIGGTFTATLVRFPLAQALIAFRTALVAFHENRRSPRELIRTACALSDIVRKKGFLALEGYPAGNPLLQKAIDMAADGHEVELIEQVVRDDMEQERERHQTGMKVFRAIGESAPAFGMIGTLVGLVQMLSNMSNPDSMGPAMAVALLTTLYGALIANLVALPIAEKLELRDLQDRTLQQIILNSVPLIMAGKHPRIIEEILIAFLPHNQRHNDDGPAADADALADADAGNRTTTDHDRDDASDKSAA